MILLTLFCVLNLLVATSAVSAGEGPFELHEDAAELDHTSSDPQQISHELAPTATLTSKPRTEPALGPASEPWRSLDNQLNLVRLINGRHYENRYVYLSHMLEQSLPDNEDLDANLANAKHWLELERTGQFGFGNRATSEALEQFIALSKLNDEETRCSFEAYEILYKNDKATGGRSHRSPSKFRPLMRIDRLVHLASRRHTEACFDVYPKRFAELTTELKVKDSDSFERLREFLDQVLECEDCVTSKVRDLRTDRASEKAFELIERYSKKGADAKLRQNLIDQQRGSSTVNAVQVRALAKHYIIEPCRAYAHSLGTNVYVPARFAMSVLESNDRYDAKSSEYRDFLHGWLHYRLCESLVRHDQEALVRALVRKYQRALQDRKLEN